MNAKQIILVALAVTVIVVFSYGTWKISAADPVTDTEPTAEQRPSLRHYVTRQKGTEPPFSGEYWDSKKPGIYRCVDCGAALFSSEAKYDSGTGWPSFSGPIDKANLEERGDGSLLARRIEVLCRQCEAHLGHVFPDGAPPTGLRYCINSVSLRLDENAALPE